MLRTIIFRLLLETLTMLTNAHAVHGRPTLKDLERFWNGLVRELKEKSINTMNSINSVNTLSTNKNTNEQTMNTTLNINMNTNSCIDGNYYSDPEYQNPDIRPLMLAKTNRRTEKIRSKRRNATKQTVHGITPSNL
jgi:hypothetical protein